LFDFIEISFFLPNCYTSKNDKQQIFILLAWPAFYILTINCNFTSTLKTQDRKLIA